jgi:hypothetical protein
MDLKSESSIWLARDTEGTISVATDNSINHLKNQSPKGKDYPTELAFLRLGDILSEIASTTNKTEALDKDNIQINRENSQTPLQTHLIHSEP